MTEQQNRRQRSQTRRATKEKPEKKEAKLLPWLFAHSRPLIVLLVLGALIVFMYPAIRNYYVSLRTREVLQEYSALIQSENDELGHDLSRLQTTDGIEDEARRRGYVKEGETAVAVEGLPAEKEEDLTQAPKIEDKRSGWTKFWDGLFAFKPESVQV